MMKATLLVALCLVAGAAGHGSMIMPPSRNSVDASPGMAWADGKHPETGLIEPVSAPPPPPLSSNLHYSHPTHTLPDSALSFIGSRRRKKKKKEEREKKKGKATTTPNTLSVHTRTHLQSECLARARISPPPALLLTLKHNFNVRAHANSTLANAPTAPTSATTAKAASGSRKGLLWAARARTVTALESQTSTIARSSTY